VEEGSSPIPNDVAMSEAMSQHRGAIMMIAFYSSLYGCPQPNQLATTSTTNLAVQDTGFFWCFNRRAIKKERREEKEKRRKRRRRGGKRRRKRERLRNIFISLTLSACPTISAIIMYLMDQLSHLKIRINSQDGREQDFIMSYVDWADIDKDIKAQSQPQRYDKV
jgi:hypothetical protein